jgi:hypothetical protein
MHQLENQIGLKLFYKKGRKLIPTSTAQMLYPSAKKVLELKLAVIEEIKMLSGSYRGLVKVRASSVPGSYILPDLISDFLSKNRYVMIEFYTSGEKLPKYLTFPKKAIAYSINVKVGKQNYALVGFGGIVSPSLPKLFSQEVLSFLEFLTRGILKFTSYNDTALYSTNKKAF